MQNIRVGDVVTVNGLKNLKCLVICTDKVENHETLEEYFIYYICVAGVVRPFREGEITLIS